MANIFGRTDPTLGGVFTADMVQVFLGGGLGPTLMQSFGLQFSQPIARIYEVGGPNMYYVVGRAQGGSQVGRVVGPNNLIASFYAQFGDACNAANNTITFVASPSTCAFNTSSANAGAGVTYSAGLCVLSNFGLQTQAQDMLISENLQLMVGTLDYNNGAAAA